MLAHGRWFSPGTPASSTTKTVCHDIADESGIKHQKSNQINLKQHTKSIISGIKISSRPVANVSNICVGRHIIRIIVAQLAIAQFN